MRCSWVPGGALGLILLAASMSHAQVAPKAARNTVARQATPVAKKSNKRKTASRKKTAKAALPVPSRPPADLPEVTEPASVWGGCLAPSALGELASKLKIEETRLGSVLSDLEVLPQPQSECVPYMAATGGEGGAASATFQPAETPESRPPAVSIHKSADGVVAVPGACDCPEMRRRVFTLPASRMNESPNEAMASLPPNVLWQLQILVPRMVAKLAARHASSSEIATGLTDESYVVRVVLERGRNRMDGDADFNNDGLVEPERLESIEIVDSVSGVRLDGAWWVERQKVPGVLIGMDGIVYERLLWQSPVKYRSQTRGVGPRTRTIRRRVSAGKDGTGGKMEVRTIRVAGYHLGVDMTAPKGSDVHAIGDATVAFAGRKGGFGKLVILDHGLGYQTYYAHLSVIRKGIKPGATVSRGELIGLVGSTGRSTAPHLHFEARKNGIYFNLFDESHEPEFWLLSPDDQERLAMRLLAPTAESHQASTAAQYRDRKVSIN